MLNDHSYNHEVPGSSHLGFKQAWTCSWRGALACVNPSVSHVQRSAIDPIIPFWRPKGRHVDPPLDHLEHGV